MKLHTRKKLAAGLTALGIMGLLAVTTVSAATQHQNRPSNPIHEAIHQAIENNDYAA
jgi:hypothetical protein